MLCDPIDSAQIGCLLPSTRRTRSALFRSSDQKCPRNLWRGARGHFSLGHNGPGFYLIRITLLASWLSPPAAGTFFPHTATSIIGFPGGVSVMHLPLCAMANPQWPAPENRLQRTRSWKSGQAPLEGIRAFKNVSNGDRSSVLLMDTHNGYAARQYSWTLWRVSYI